MYKIETLKYPDKKSRQIYANVLFYISIKTGKTWFIQRFERATKGMFDANF
jgi:hypothetical protein